MELTARELELLRTTRRATLGTIAPDGRPRLLPIAFIAIEEGDGELAIYSPLDEKPKSVSDPRDLARVRDIAQRPRVTVLMDEWDEDWTRLAWLRLDGAAAVIEPAADIVARLRAKYEQYAAHRLEERPIIRIQVERAVSWWATP